ncbi:MAG: hypothetical protein WKF34_09560 [Pyrinomonadaceae bacterium]
MQDSEFNVGVIHPIECVKEGFALIKSDYWLLLAISLVGAMIGGVTLMIASGAMTCGTYYAYLRKIDGGDARFDDLWKGMQWFGPGLALMVIIILPIIAIYSIIFVPFLLSASMGGRLSQEELMGLLIGSFVVEVVLAFVMVCLQTLLIFAFPLIVDRNLGVFEAIRLSSRAVLRNLGGVAGLIFVNIGLMIAGYLALCIGIYFVIPIVIAGNVVAYRKIFPKPLDRSHEPPPVSAYGGG